MKLNLYTVKHKALDALVWWISTRVGSITGCLGYRMGSAAPPHTHTHTHTSVKAVAAVAGRGLG